MKGNFSNKGSGSATGTAVVVKHTGSHYLLSRLPEWNPFIAVVRGKLRLKGSSSTNPVAVGDVVDYQEDNAGSFTITGIHDRRNCIVRKSQNLSRQNHVIAANIDRVFLTVTLRDPEVKLQFVDRFLVTCEAYGVPVTILLNKADLYRGEEGSDSLADEDLAQMAAGFVQIYEGAGYQVMETSVKTGLNISRLKSLCKDKVVLFSGQSGVGKSSLVNALDPSLNLKTAEISQAHLQGRHTTTFYQMHPLSCGGFVVDTPGIRGFGLVDFKKEELSNFFPEMLRIEDNCRFAPCTHTHEPGCAVKEAVEKGEISPLRYSSYLAMLEDDGKYREGDE
ncbi:MAG: ribosome small subunit-dependent GTPase A [Bacteroidales bacterium]|jgi:ribosome biogenesis GTPase|nr:ribosome small subunit-dependent GTPase A [Bacteroidales bacterium]